MHSQSIRRETRTFRWLFAIFVFIAVAIAFGYAVLNVGSRGEIREWLVLLSVIQLAPFVIFLATGRPNYISFVFLEYFAGYSVNKWQSLSGVGGEAIQFHSALRAIQELTFCMMLMGCVYYFAKFLLDSLAKRSTSGIVFKPLTLKPLPYLCISLLASIGPLFLTWLPSSFQSLFHVSAYMAAVLILTASCPDRPIFEPIAKVLLVWGGFLVFLYDASLGLFGLIITYLFILGCLYRKYAYFIIIIPLFGLLFLFQSIKGQYRYFVFYSNETPVKMSHLTILHKLLVYELSGMSQMENLDEFDNVVEVPDDSAIQQEQVVEHWVNGYTRMGDDSLERVMDMTPSQVPFWEGETYYPTLLMFIPRIIWPDKPGRAFWNKFGRLYGYLLDEDTTTSVAVGYLAEGYMNFGFLGMYGVAVFIALLIAGVECLGYYVFNGYYSFTFTLMLLPFCTYSSDLGSIINAIALVIGVLAITRYRLAPLTQNDEYS